MSRRLSGNFGVDHLGTTSEKKEKTKRTRRDSFVLGSAVNELLTELCVLTGLSRAETVRTLIVREHHKRFK